MILSILDSCYTCIHSDTLVARFSVIDASNLVCCENRNNLRFSFVVVCHVTVRHLTADAEEDTHNVSLSVLKGKHSFTQNIVSVSPPHNLLTWYRTDQ